MSADGNGLLNLRDPFREIGYDDCDERKIFFWQYFFGSFLWQYFFVANKCLPSFLWQYFFGSFLNVVSPYVFQKKQSYQITKTSC